MDFQLLVVKGRGASTIINLADGVTTVGRQDDCQLRIKSSQVSRKHCELFEKKGMLLVKDLGSSNGTFVNGKRVQGQQVLEPGDELTIGQVLLKVSKIGAPDTEAASVSKPKPADTAVVEAAPDAGSDNFDIEFDLADESSEVAATEDYSTSAVDQAKTEPRQSEEPRTEPAKPAAKEKEEDKLGEDAIADFLLDLKLDED